MADLPPISIDNLSGDPFPFKNGLSLQGNSNIATKDTTGGTKFASSHSSCIMHLESTANKKITEIRSFIARRDTPKLLISTALITWSAPVSNYAQNQLT